MSPSFRAKSSIGQYDKTATFGVIQSSQGSHSFLSRSPTFGRLPTFGKKASVASGAGATFGRQGTFTLIRAESMVDDEQDKLEHLQQNVKFLKQEKKKE